MKAKVSSGFQERITAACETLPKTDVVDKLIQILHRVLEVVFERQGFEASRHFLGADGPQTHDTEDRYIYEIAEEELQNGGFDLDKDFHLLLAVKQSLRGIFYQSTTDEPAFCARLARTYILLFTIRNTPEIINYFNSMSKHLTLTALNVPFEISSAIQGGGDYLVLLANGAGVIGLEAHFEFSNGGKLGFGPLAGTGRIPFGLHLPTVSDGRKPERGLVGRSRSSVRLSLRSLPLFARACAPRESH